MICNQCGSENLQKRGIRNDKQRLECQDCGAWMTSEIQETNSIANPVLLFDIETSIRRAFLFSPGEQYVHYESFEDEPMVLGYSAKYAGDSRIFSEFVTPNEAKNRDHSRIVKSLWKLLSTVNTTVSYNGSNFDVRVMNSFFIKQRLGLPNRIRNIDPYLLAKQIFKLDSYKMDYVVKYLDLDDGKHKMERQDWIDCYYGRKDALNKMQKYCDHDVQILELVSDAIAPYAPSLPNAGVYGNVEEKQCPCCGSVNYSDNGNTYTSFGKYNSYRCNDCTALFRSRKNLLSKVKRSNLMAF